MFSITNAYRAVQASKPVQSALYVGLVAMPMMIMAGEAAAVDNGGSSFKEYTKTFFGKFDFSDTIPLAAGLAGTVYGAMSTVSLVETWKEGGRVTDNRQAVMGLAGSAIALAYAGVKGVLAYTGQA